MLLEHFKKHGIDQEQLDAIAELMDPEIREQVHSELAPCEPLEFLIRYCDLDPEFAETKAW